MKLKVRFKNRNKRTGETLNREYAIIVFNLHLLYAVDVAIDAVLFFVLFALIVWKSAQYENETED